MQLSPQTIIRLAKDKNMISPFYINKLVIRGKSAGLSTASYDMTIGHDLTLGVNPSYIVASHLVNGHGLIGDAGAALRFALRDNPPHAALAYTNEDLDMPEYVAAQVADKSTYARVFCSAFNTFIDPGFKGNLTLELVNHGPNPVVIKAGDPVVQLLFTWLDQPTDRPYRGKYQHQTPRAHGPRIEMPPMPHVDDDPLPFKEVHQRDYEV